MYFIRLKYLFLCFFRLFLHNMLNASKLVYVLKISLFIGVIGLDNPLDKLAMIHKKKKNSRRSLQN